MEQVIIYQHGDGVAIVYPSPEALRTQTILEIAEKDTPAGVPFKVIDAADLPANSQQEQWYVDVADLTDGVGRAV